ncbi:MAG: hypothetical protein WC735_01930 [Candidatus Paceibacterota bacterium]|jgi:hypothetical protein
MTQNTKSARVKFFLIITVMFTTLVIGISVLQAKEKTSKEIDKVIVTGSIYLGPVCSVVTYPTTESCADKPFETTIYFVSSDGQLRKSATSNRKGIYEVRLSADTYTITNHSIPPNPGEITTESYPILKTRGPITFDSKKTTRLDILFDSGIR